jgi:hypothetical protein
VKSSSSTKVKCHKIVVVAVLLMLLSLSNPGHSNTRAIIVITSLKGDSSSERYGDTIQQVLTLKMRIPPKLTSHLRRAEPCAPQSEAIIHICIDKNTKMRFLVVNDRAVRAFQVFYQKKRDNNLLKPNGSVKRN